MDKNFERRLRLAMNPRARKHRKKKLAKFKRARSNLGVLIEELKEDMSNTPDPSRYNLLFPSNAEMSRRVAAPLTLAAELACAAAMDGAAAIKKQSMEKERQAKLERRRTYYVKEKEKRAKQRKQILAARPKPENARPKPDELMSAYLHRRDSFDSPQRFGKLIIDLEEYVRRKYEFSGNKFSGSFGGVKAWLQDNCPFLAAHYSTCQHYKRLAQEDFTAYGDIINE